MRKKEVRSIESPFNVFKCHVWRRKLRNISTFYVNAQFLSAKPLFNYLFNTVFLLLGWMCAETPFILLFLMLKLEKAF